MAPSTAPPPVRLALVVTHGMTARLLQRGQPRFLSRHGFEVLVVSSPGPDLDAVEEEEGVAVRGVRMARGIAPLSDLLALVRLVRLFRRERPELVNAGTPKAGLLGMLAARLARVPVRLYTLRGLRLETTEGWRSALLRRSERSAAAAAHRVICVSSSLRRRYLELQLAPESKVGLLGAGSSNGVDCERFRPATPAARERRELRRRLGLPDDAPVVGFVGRLTRDKGIGDLLAAFREAVWLERPECRLLLVGGFEAGDPVPDAVRATLRDEPRVAMTGAVEDAAPYYSVMDLVAFPSYREGFPNVPLEAAACGLAVVGYAATGTVDAVETGRTGALVPVGDRAALGSALLAYLGDDALRREHGAAGRRRVEEHFRNELVWERWLAEYRRLLDAARSAA